MYTNTKPSFTFAPDPPPPPPALPLPSTPSELGDTEGDDDSPEWCTCGAEATLFPLGSPALCYDCAFVTTPRTRLSYRAVYAKYSVTLQSLAIEAKLTVCGRCQGIHHVQKCPDLLALLLAGAA